ncbi:MAG: response regulator [Armatimonadota bacterium]|nr:response regulator [Armatimonadota bacterium]MCX7777405.1 response regulator [Armatimonadota bacterium]MDW8025074.1 response regulator [Armatimonadota bacterium]
MSSERQFKILVADDEVSITELVKANLEREGYEVIVAGDGSEALRRIHSEHPDLVILDVLMPHLDGYEVLEAMRAHPETANIPVIMLTAFPSDIGAIAAFEHEADSYLHKPFDPEVLIALVKRLLSERNASGSQFD